MSDQSSESVPDRTGREQLFLLLSGVCLFFLIIAGFWWLDHQMEKLIFQQNRKTCRLLVNQAMYVEHFESWEAEALAALLAERLAHDLRTEAYEYSFVTPKTLAAGSTGSEQEQGRS